MYGIQIVPGLLKAKRYSSKVDPSYTKDIQITSIVSFVVITIIITLRYEKSSR